MRWQRLQDETGRSQRFSGHRNQAMNAMTSAMFALQNSLKRTERTPLPRTRIVAFGGSQTGEDLMQERASPATGATASL